MVCEGDGQDEPGIGDQAVVARKGVYLASVRVFCVESTGYSPATVLKVHAAEEPVATTIGFVSEKGGVGKTTSVYHVAVGLVRFHKKKVLVLDTDYQRGGLTCRLRPEMLEDFRLGETGHTTLFHVYQAFYSGSQNLPPLTVLPTKDDIDLVPADPRLNSVSVDKMPPTNSLRANNGMLVRHHGLIQEALRLIDYSEEPYDFILVDSHPDLDDLEKAVIYASDKCISPVKLDNQSATGVPSTVEAIRNVNEDIQAVATMIDVLPSYKETVFLGAAGMMCREYGGGLKYSEQIIFNRLRRTTGILDTYVTEGDGIRQAAANGRSVYDVDGPNARKQAEQYERLVEEIIYLA